MPPIAGWFNGCGVLARIDFVWLLLVVFKMIRTRLKIETDGAEPSAAHDRLLVQRTTRSVRAPRRTGHE
jgi:hypothetical protein